MLNPDKLIHIIQQVYSTTYLNEFIQITCISEVHATLSVYC